MPLLSYDEYYKTNRSTPYFYKIKSGDSFLYYFGEKHSFDPKNKQWETMKSFWTDFLKETENKKRIVFIESGNVRPKETEEETIIEMGGGGLAAFLAFQNSVPTFWSEPTFRDQFIELEKYFSHEEIIYYYFSRTVNQWHKTDKSKKFEDYTRYFLERDRKESGWDDIDFSINGMAKIHKNIFGTEFDYNDQKFFSEIPSPVELKTVINKVSRLLSRFRDEYIVNKIKEYINNGYSIYCQYGSGHAIVEEPLLREIL